METVFYSASENDTFAFGKALGELAGPGTFIALNGDLGTGKTVIAKGIAEGLGVRDRVTSPTFNIVKQYDGRCRLYHFDVYRISDPDEMHEIGFSDYLAGDAVVIAEWADMISDLLPGERLTVGLEYDGDGRKITLKGTEKYSGLIDEIIRRAGR